MEREFTALYHIWLRDQHQRRVLKIHRESLEQVLLSPEFVSDFGLRGGRGIRTIIDDNDSSVASQNLDFVKNINKILQTSIE